MEHLHVLRYIATLEQRLKAVETNASSTSSTTSSTIENVVIPTDLSQVLSRLSALEARPVVDLNEVSNRLAAVEARPELSQRLSALELAITSQNP